MNFLFTKIRDKHALWYKGIVFAFCVIACTYLLPKGNSTQINQINTGDVWLNNDLESTVDFLVKKTAEELASEKKEATKRVAYFKKTSGNINDLVSQLSDLPHNKAVSIKLVSDSIYNVGVYFQNEQTMYQDSLMYLVNNNEVSLIKKEKLFNKEKINRLLLQ